MKEMITFERCFSRSNNTLLNKIYSTNSYSYSIYTCHRSEQINDCRSAHIIMHSIYKCTYFQLLDSNASLNAFNFGNCENMSYFLYSRSQSGDFIFIESGRFFFFIYGQTACHTSQAASFCSRM